MNRVDGEVRTLTRAPWSYAAAIVAAAAAVFARHLLDPYVTGVQFITFFPAAMAVAYLCGSRPALLTTFLCGLAGWYLFLAPLNSFVLPRQAETISLATFFVVSGVMSLSIGGLSAALKRERRHVAQQRLLVDELNHRVKNNLSVVQSIARHTLKPPACEPWVRAEFEGRLVALAAAHEGLARRNWQPVQLAALLDNLINAIGLEPGRVELEGDDVLLQPKGAVTLTLALHELATNAMKYGALSDERGRVKVSWTMRDGRLEVRWEESDGPRVRRPDKRGFGTVMVEKALTREFGGQAKIDFLPGGVVCTIVAPMQDIEEARTL